MVQLGLTANFKRQFLQCYGSTVPMKEPSGILGHPDLNNCEMLKVVMQTVEPASTRKVTEKLVKILDSTYAKADLKQVDNSATQVNA